jgi:hypothetical protein
MEEKKNLGITNLNGVTDDEDTTCGITDLNCVDGQEASYKITDLNSVDEKDTTCDITDLNCIN